MGFIVAKDAGRELSNIAEQMMNGGGNVLESFANMERGIQFMLAEGGEPAENFRKEVEKLKGYLLDKNGFYKTSYLSKTDYCYRKILYRKT
jgi:hypothetical protein